MSKRVKHTKRVFAMLLAFIMCLSQAVTAAADEVSDNKTAPETVSDEEVPEEPAEAVSGEAVSGDAEETSGESDLVYGNLKYKVVENEVTILGLSDNSPSEIHDLVIPDTIDGKPVTVISDNAFSFSDRLEGSLIIPNSVTTIGAEAFMSCELLKGDLIIPENVVTIGYEAFYGCQGFDGNLRIGSSVTVISQNAFWGCRNLSGDLFIPESVKTIDSCAFYGCTGLTGTLTIPESLSNIQDHSFYGLYGITRIINNSDHDLKVSQFWEDKDDDKMVCFRRSDGSEMNTKHGGILNKKSTYERKVLPTQIISGKKTLDVNIGTPLTVSVNLLPDNAYDRITWGSNNNNIATVSNGVVTGIGPGKAIITASVKNNYGQSYSETLTVNVKYRVSGDLIYKYSKDGDEVIILKHKDGENAAGELVIPESIDEKPVTVISDNAFKGCSGLTGGLTIPESVQVIGDNAFYGCTGLTGDLTIPGNVKIIGKEAFWNSGFDGKLTIEDGVKTISNMAFLQCSKFTEDLEIPDSVETIGNQAFEQCEGFDGSLKIGNSVETIGDRAFYLCPGFKGRLTIGNSVKTIGEHAFYGCNNFTGDLVIPDSVESIKTSAFEGWKNINGKLTIGTGVNWIDTDAFKGWYSVSGIIKKSAATANIDWFWDKDDDDTVCFVSDNGTEIHKGENIEAGTYVRKVKPTGVSLNKTALDVLIGTSQTLTAAVSPENAYSDKVSWNSSDKSVATVSEGVITGIKPGNTVITVTTVYGGLSANCVVTVLDKPPVPVTGVTLNKSALGMYPNETETLTATVLPADAVNKAVRWFSSNEKVATVNNGKVTSVSPGSAVITVSTNDGGFTATCAVTVYAKTTAHKVTFKNEDGSVYATQTVANGKQAADPGAPAKAGFIFIGWSDGASIWNFTTPVNKDLVLTAKYKAEQVKVSENSGSGMDPTPVTDAPEKKGDKTAYKLYLVKDQTFTAGGQGWSSDDKTVASVASKTGKITGKKTGTATVENDTTVYTVYVAEPSVSKNSKNVTVLVGQSAEVGIDLQAVAGTENKYPVTWYSANPKVAVVNGGMVTGVAKGSTKVKAYVGGKTYDATVKVIDTYKAPSKYTDSRAEFAMNPLQSFGVKFDSNVFIIKNAVWSGDGMTEVKNSKGNVTGYKNGVISIANSGKFTAIGPGTTTVTGKDSKSNTVTVTVTVVPVATKEAVYITKGKTDTIKFPKVTNKNADWWKSSNENAAAVDTVKKTGKVTAKAYGRSDISCLYKDFTFNTTAYIEDPEMIFAGKTINIKDKVEMKAGEMKQFKVSKTYQTLNYKSSKQAIVFVDENGFVYARKPGKATISTKINGATYKFTVEVK